MPIDVVYLLVIANTALISVALLVALRLTAAVSRLVDQIDDVEEVEV